MLMLKRVHSGTSEAHALISNFLPTPGGPYKRMPFQGLWLPVNIWGKRRGNTIASFKVALAFYRPNTSSQHRLSFSLTMASSYALFICSF